MPIWHEICLQELLVHGLTSQSSRDLQKNKHLPAIKHEIMEEERCMGSLHPRHTKKKQVVTYKTNPRKNE
jgi:hypothetical protein